MKFTGGAVNKKPRIAVVLGSGAAKGLAHIGVLKVLDEIGIKPDIVTGTSMGSIIGALYASGLKASEIEMIASSMERSDIKKFFSFTFGEAGLADGAKIREFLEDFLPFRKIQEFPIPFACCSCSITDGREIIFDKGDAVEALRASSSIPVLLTPDRIGDSVLVDGGLVNPVPVSIARRMGADIVIAVNVLNTPILENKTLEIPDSVYNNEPARETSQMLERLNDKMKNIIEREKREIAKTAKTIGSFLNMNDQINIIDIASQTFMMAESNLAKYRLSIDKADYLIEPDMSDIKHLDFLKIKEAVLIGEKEAWKAASKYKMEKLA